MEIKRLKSDEIAPIKILITIDKKYEISELEEYLNDEYSRIVNKNNKQLLHLTDLLVNIAESAIKGE